MTSPILRVLKAADHLASAVNTVRDDARRGLATDKAKQIADRCRDDLDLAIDALTDSERDTHADQITLARQCAEAGSNEAIARMIYLHHLETASVDDMPTLITQALEQRVSVSDIMDVTGLSRALVEAHELDREPLPPELQAVADADIEATLLEKRLAQARERRSRAAHAAADSGFSWYRISQTVGRSQSTLQRW